MLTKLEDSIDAQRQLVADASHELRTPLTALRTNLELLAEPPGLTDPGAPELIRQARRGAQDLAELVGDLVRLARYGQAPPCCRMSVSISWCTGCAIGRMSAATNERCRWTPDPSS